MSQKTFAAVAHMMTLHSVTRCDNVKITQLLGEITCVRMPGHFGKHWDGGDERWE